MIIMSDAQAEMTFLESFKPMVAFPLGSAVVEQAVHKAMMRCLQNEWIRLVDIVPAPVELKLPPQTLARLFCITDAGKAHLRKLALTTKPINGVVS